MDWSAWHDQYDLSDSWMARRLRTVQAHVRTALSEAPAGELRVTSVCAGEGRDLLDVLAGHPRRDDVRARLVELDPRNTAAAAERVGRAGLWQVEVVTGDAAIVDQYEDMAPAELVLVCGVFGNITDADIERTIAACSHLCKVGGTVIGTRHRAAPDRVPQICEWFEAQGFELRWLSAPDTGFGVGVHRFVGTPQPLRRGTRLFEFVGYDVLRQAATTEFKSVTSPRPTTSASRSRVE
ncbi:class I SAM-dependent methyltransferase [Streptomyces sp. NPDC056121]|uniref:class I SAM-dependent methyltransferase n=1 Tax=unclassified Streptomyces TaxID=2593676 RepID=UPI0035E1286B